MTYREAEYLRDALYKFIQIVSRTKKDGHGLICPTWRPVAKRYFQREERDFLVRFGFAKSKGRYLVVTNEGMMFPAFLNKLSGFEEAEERGREARWQAFCGGLN